MGRSDLVIKLQLYQEETIRQTSPMLNQSWVPTLCLLLEMVRIWRVHFALHIQYICSVSICTRTQPEASDCGEQSQPQSENLADFDWNCLLSKLLYLLMPISSCQKYPFRTTKELESNSLEQQSYLYRQKYIKIFFL